MLSSYFQPLKVLGASKSFLYLLAYLCNLFDMCSVIYTLYKLESAAK